MVDEKDKKDYEGMNQLITDAVKSTAFTAKEIGTAWKSIFPRLGLSVKEK